jgi:ketosteroid isomerase-like protein
MAEESTTPDLVALTLRSFEAVQRGDVDAMVGYYGPDSAWDNSHVGETIHEGLGQIRGFFEDWLGAFDELQVEVEEVSALGHEVIFLIVRQHARPIGGGGHVGVRYAHVNVWSAGVIMRSTVYLDIDEGRAAAERLAEERG